MLPSATIVDTPLRYTLVAADTLGELFLATQIPFLGSVRSLAVAIIPVVQMGSSDHGSF